MATLRTERRFEPIAAELGKIANPALLFPPPVIESVERGELPGEADSAWSSEVRDFMAHQLAVAGAAQLLLGAPAFEGLGRLQDELESEYEPSGPPLSPIYDSYALQHLLAEVPRGPAGETPYSVLARLSAGDPARARLSALAQSLAASHLELYRVEQAAGREGLLVPLRGGQALTVYATGPFLEDGDRLLGRAVPFEGRVFMGDTPYLLDASEADWLDYFERVAAADAATREAEPRAKASPKLSPKRAAEQRKLAQQRAARHAPHEVVSRHLRFGASPRFWLEFFMEAYSGERRGLARLAGVPDRHEPQPAPAE